MSVKKKPTANIEALLEEYGLPHYRWQCVLHLIRAGNKEGVPELDDLTAAQDYLRRDITCIQKERRSFAATASSATRKKPTQRPTAPVNATPSVKAEAKQPEAQVSAV